MVKVIQNVEERKDKENTVIVHLTEEEIEHIDGVYGGDLIDVGDIKVEIHKKEATKYTSKGTFSLEISSQQLDAIREGKGVLYEDVKASPIKDKINVILISYSR